MWSSILWCVHSSSITLLSFIRSIALHFEDLWGDHNWSTTDLIVILMSWVLHSWSSRLVACFRRWHSKFRALILPSRDCRRFSRRTLSGSCRSEFALNWRLLLSLINLARIVVLTLDWSRCAFSPCCHSWILTSVHRHFPVLELVEQLIVGTIRTLLVVHSIGSHDLFNILLLLNLWLLFLGHVILPGKGIVIHHSDSNVILDLYKLWVHRSGIHTAHNRLARNAVKAYVVVWPILILIVIKVPLWHLLELLALLL